MSKISCDHAMLADLWDSDVLQSDTMLHNGVVGIMG